MTPEHEMDRQIRTWLRAGPTEFPDDVLRDVIDQVPTIAQRRGRSARWTRWQPWGSITRDVLGLASAVTVAAVLLAVIILNGREPPVVGPAPSGSPSAAVEQTVAPPSAASVGASAEPASSASLAPSHEPTSMPTPTSAPTDAGWPSSSPKPRSTDGPGARVETTGVSYPEAVLVGDPLILEVAMRNRGDTASAPINFRVTGLSDHAKVVQCVPGCDSTVVYGEIRVVFRAGLGAGEAATFAVEFQSVAAGGVDWEVAVGQGGALPFLAICHTYISPGRTLTPTIAPPPSNDAPPGIIIGELPFTDSTNVVLADIHAEERATPCGSGGKSVWYTYTAVAAATVEANTFGSDYDTVLDIWRGSLSTGIDPGFATLQLLGCNDDSGSPQSAVVFATEAGQAYTIRVAAKDGGGNLTFNLVPR